MTELTGTAGRRTSGGSATLENYRDQDVDFEFDLARVAGFRAGCRSGAGR